MRQLESDIVDLNSMFKDISVLVHEQGDLVGNYLVVSQYIKLQKWKHLLTTDFYLKKR
jgi:hypothetical protein